jgi:hypothetical protein
MTPSFRLASLLALGWLAGCAVPPAAPPSGLTEVAERPAEKALLAGLRAYEDGQYGPSERQLQTALQIGLVSPRDRAVAHKHLAFIFCTSSRVPACEAQFRAARQDDPNFVLNKSEAGHPLWGPVYLRALQP